MNGYVKAAIVAAGYVAAFVIASAAVAVRVASQNHADAAAAGGMYAFGDLALFVIVFVIVAVLPTGAALFFLLSARRQRD